MAEMFTIGERKVVPGVYYRYENVGTPLVAGEDSGKCACTVRSNWGPLNKVVVLEAYESISKIYGDIVMNSSGEEGVESFLTGDGKVFTTGDNKPFNVPSNSVNTLAVAIEQFKGGAQRVFAARVGVGGTQGSYQITDYDDTAVIQLILKYPGSRAFDITIRPTLDDPNVSELLILENTVEKERLTFANTAGANNVKSLIDAYTAKGSNYFTLSKLADSTAVIATIDQSAITPGEDPVVNVGAYSAAFEALEAYRWNVLAIDTNDTAIQIMMQLFLNRIFKFGSFTMGVIAEGSDVTFETKLTHARAYNDFQIVYVGNGFVDLNNDVYEGYLAAARISGMIASTPSNNSITHSAITGATDLTEKLTPYQTELAINAGMLTFSTSAAGSIWVTRGINTLITLNKDQDEGWKKIKRTKVRFELFQRLNDTVDPLIGKIDNDPDGRGDIIQIGNDVCIKMMGEKKLLAGAHVELDADNPPEGDSAWFRVYVDDIDALEFAYFVFGFRFAPAAE